MPESSTAPGQATLSVPNPSTPPKRGVALIIGEVLWDCFDDRRVLGGAPLNVAWNLAGFGLDPLFVSAVGDDPLGHEVLQRMRQWGLSTEAVAVLPGVPTGTVQVTMHDGEPHYEIVSGVAYDQIPVPNDAILSTVHRRVDEAKQAGFDSLLYHGSLAYRSESTRRSIDRWRAAWPATIFLDINIRQPHFDSSWLASLLPRTNIIKLNQAELGLISGREVHDTPGRQAAAKELLAHRPHLSARDSHRGSGHVVSQPVADASSGNAEALAEDASLQGLLVTLGADGAEAYWSSSSIDSIRPIFVDAPTPDPMIDPVGAGDAFASVVLHDWLRRPNQSAVSTASSTDPSSCVEATSVLADPSTSSSAWSATLRRAVTHASRVCGLAGATTDERGFYHLNG